ncbi:hypothetical protein [Kitasatospora sp. SUK 42]|nr:hypothetical protein [Kitasatospora sp. SUK 42]MBV2155406.1 hypothetical protein [Kitasatospora sp. SUK 42]
MAATTAGVIRGEGLCTDERFDHWRELARRTRAGEVAGAHAGNGEQ